MPEDAVGAKRLLQGGWDELVGHKSFLGLMNTQKLHRAEGILNPGNAGSWKSTGEKVVGTCYSWRWDGGWQNPGLEQQSCAPAPLGVWHPRTQSDQKSQNCWWSNLPSAFPTTSPVLLCPVKAGWWILTEMSAAAALGSCANHSPISCKGIPHHYCKVSTFSSFGEFHLACERLSFS